jgi:hypothetical protein
MRTLPAKGEGGACYLRQAPGLPAIAGSRSRRGPRVKPFTPDTAGPSQPNPLATAMIAA